MQQVSELLTPEQTSQKLGVSKSTLAVWRCRKRYSLPYVKVGSKVFYRPQDLEKFIEKRLVR